MKMTSTNKENDFSVKPFLDKINLIFNAILALPLVVFAWLYLEAKSGHVFTDFNPTVLNTLNFIIPILVLSIIGVTFRTFKRKVNAIAKDIPLSEKLDHYFTFEMYKYAGLESALIISTVGYYSTYSNTMVVMFVIVLVFFSLHKPMGSRIANNLGLGKEEKELLIRK